MKILNIVSCCVFLIFAPKIEVYSVEWMDEPQQVSTPQFTNESMLEIDTQSPLEGRGGLNAKAKKKRCAPCRCGIRNRTKSKIVGGAETKPHEYPWISELQLHKQFFCSGALINDQYVLTAAHCVKSHVNEKDLTVNLGEHDRKNPKDSTLIVKRIVKVIIHPEYKPTTSTMNDNDLALLQLDSPVKYNRNVKPICLPQKGLTFAGRKATVAGWGRTSEKGKTSMTLRAVQVPIMSNQVCARLPGFNAILTKNMICAGYLRKGGKDTCQGDSGGALMVEYNAQKTVVAGVVSWGVGCAKVQKPGVYTRVNNYLGWIKANTRNACYC